MITLDHVSKRYGSVHALRDVTLTVERGKTVGLLGRNGAGKTTALNLMTGLFPPDAGRVIVDGEDMMKNGRACKRKIGYLPEYPPLYDEMTVRDYLRFASDLKEVDGRDRERHVKEILGLCGLEEVADRVIGHLSKGYRQRTGIAQALCGQPEALILDEPTVGLDPKQVVEIRDLIRQLGEHRTILFSSHILSEVQQMCQVVLILHEGRLIRDFRLDGEETDDLRLRLRVLGREGEVLSALRSLGCVKKVERREASAPGEAACQLTCRKQDERGRVEDQIFRLMCALDTPIREMAPVRNDLEKVFLEATEG